MGDDIVTLEGWVVRYLNGRVFADAERSGDQAHINGDGAMVAIVSPCGVPRDVVMKMYEIWDGMEGER